MMLTKQASWPTVSAEGYAVMEDGKVTRLVVTEGGSGYSSPPKITIKGREAVRLEATLHLDKDFKKNGSIESVKLIEMQTQR